MHTVTKTTAVMLCSVLAVLAGCRTVRVSDGEIGERNTANIGDPEMPCQYEVRVQYFNQNEIGITESVDDIRALVLRGKYQGHDYFRWQDYSFRSFEVPEDSPIENRLEFSMIAADDTAEWTTESDFVGYDYVVDDTVVDRSGQLGNLPDLSFLEKDLDSFKLYTNLIDFHMWDLYIGMCFHPEEYSSITTDAFAAVGDAVEIPQENHMIDLAEWNSVSSNLKIGGGFIYLEFIGYGDHHGERTKIIYFQQNQRLTQTVYGPLTPRVAFAMPYGGTNRFMGFLEVSEGNQLIHARFNEYVYGKVDAPFFIDVYVHHKREYTVNLVDPE
jgi:hypothetical protein